MSAFQQRFKDRTSTMPKHGALDLNTQHPVLKPVQKSPLVTSAHEVIKPPIRPMQRATDSIFHTAPEGSSQSKAPASSQPY